MFILFYLYKAEVFCTILLAIIAIVGDWLVNYSNLHIYKALFDNTTHAAIGGLTWLIISLKLRNKTALFRLSEVILCALIASIIDVDHFIVAKSFRLKDATNLQGRPPLHCSTIPLVLTILLLLYAHIFVSENIYHLAWIVFAAFSSHHIRDATRRGLWFYLFGSTRPLPYYFYVVLTMVMPHVISVCMKSFYIQSGKFSMNVEEI